LLRLPRLLRHYFRHYLRYFDAIIFFHYLIMLILRLLLADIAAAFHYRHFIFAMPLRHYFRLRLRCRYAAFVSLFAISIAICRYLLVAIIIACQRHYAITTTFRLDFRRDLRAADAFFAIDARQLQLRCMPCRC